MPVGYGFSGSETGGHRRRLRGARAITPSGRKPTPTPKRSASGPHSHAPALVHLAEKVQSTPLKQHLLHLALPHIAPPPTAPITPPMVAELKSALEASMHDVGHPTKPSNLSHTVQSLIGSKKNVLTSEERKAFKPSEVVGTGSRVKTGTPRLPKGVTLNPIGVADKLGPAVRDPLTREIASSILLAGIPVAGPLGKAAEAYRLLRGGEEAAQAVRGAKAVSEVGRVRGAARAVAARAGETRAGQATKGAVEAAGRRVGESGVGKAAKVAGRAARPVTKPAGKALRYGGRHPIQGLFGASVGAEVPGAVTAGDPGKLIHGLEGGGVLADVLAGGQKAATSVLPGVLGNAASDIIGLPATIPPSLYLTAKAAVEASGGDTKDAKGLIAGLKSEDPLGALILGGDPGRALENLQKHPVYGALEALGVKSAVGHGAGKIARTGALGKDTRDLVTTRRRPPRHFHGRVVEERGPYSRDPIQAKIQERRDVKAIQKRPGPMIDNPWKEGSQRASIKGTEGQFRRYALGAPVVGGGLVDRLAYTGDAVRRGETQKAAEELVNASRGPRRSLRRKGKVDQAAADVASLAVQPIVRDAPRMVADLKLFRQHVEQTLPHLEKPSEIAGARNMIATIDKALKNPNPEIVAKLADTFIRQQSPVVDELVKLGLLERGQADRAIATPFARFRMGATHGLDTAHELRLEEIAAERAGGGLSQSEHGKLLGEMQKIRSKAQLRVPDGQGGHRYLPTDEIYAAMREHGIHTGRFSGNAPIEATPRATATQEDLPAFEQQVKFLRQRKGKPGITIENDWIPRFQHENPRVKHVVYRDAQGEPRGMLSLYADEHGNIDHSSIFVDPKLRRQGIATEMAKAAVEAGLPVHQLGSGEAFTSEGAALRTQLLARHGGELAKRQGGDLPEAAGFLTHKMGAPKGMRASYRVADERPRMANARRTGAATTFHDPSFDALLGQAQSNIATVHAARTFDGFLREVSSKVPGVKTMADANHFLRHPEDFGDYRLDDVAGGWIAVRQSPWPEVGREMRAAQDAQNPDVAQQVMLSEEPQAVSDSLMEAAVRKARENAPDSADGNIVFVPKIEWTRYADHYKTLSEGWKAMQGAAGIFKGAVLPTSPAWLTGNAVDNYVVRLLGTGLGPKGMMRGKAFSDIVVAELGPQEGARFSEGTTPGGLYGTQKRVQPHRGADQFVEGRLAHFARAGHAFLQQPTVATLHGLLKGYQRVVFDFDHKFVETYPQYAELDRVARRDLNMTRGQFKRAVANQDKAVMDLARGFRNTHEQIRYAKRVEATFGNWGKMSPGARKYLSSMAPFWTWARAATKFVYHTLPKDHPIITALLVASSQMTRPERLALGFDFNAENPLPDFLQAGIPGPGGGNIKLSNLTSYGFFANPTESFGRMVAPEFAAGVEGMLGLDWKGDKLVNSDGTPASPLDRIKYAFTQTAGGFVPFLNDAQQVAAHGPAGLSPIKTYDKGLVDYLRTPKQSIQVPLSGASSGSATGNPWGGSSGGATTPRNVWGSSGSSAPSGNVWAP